MSKMKKMLSPRKSPRSRGGSRAKHLLGEESGTLIHQGFLTKQGGVKKNWKRRYFKLFVTQNEFTLVYYKSNTILGSLKLTNYTRCFVDTSEATETGKQYVFSVENDKRDGIRKFVFQAEDAVQMQEWMKRIQLALKSIKKKQRLARVERRKVSGIGLVCQFSEVYVNVVEVRGCGARGMKYVRIKLTGGEYIIRSAYFSGDTAMILEEHKLDAGNSEELEFSLFTEGERLVGSTRVDLHEIRGELHQGWNSLEQGSGMTIGDVEVEIVLFKDLLTVKVFGVRNLMGVSTGQTLFARVSVDNDMNNDAQRTEATKYDGDSSTAAFPQSATSALMFNGVEEPFEVTVELRTHRAGSGLGKVECVTPGPRKWLSLNNSASSSVLGSSIRSLVKVESPAPALKVKMRYDQYFALSVSHYKVLVEMLRADNFALCVSLSRDLTESSSESRISFAEAIVNVYAKAGETPALIEALLVSEIETQKETTLFRANSVVSKAIDWMQRLWCATYLEETVGSIIESVFVSTADFEVDPARDGTTENGDNLWQMYTIILESVWRSLPQIPMELRKVYAALGRHTTAKFSQDISFRSVAAFFFLRLVTPSILGPKLFGLAKSHPDAVVARRLTLLAKLVQNTANFSTFGAKEPYLEIFNSRVERKFVGMKKFLEQLMEENDSGPAPELELHEEKPYSVICRVLEEIDLSKYPRLEMEMEEIQKKHNYAIKEYSSSPAHK